MPRTRGEVETLLARLDECPAGDLEAQDLDFKDVTRADPRTVARLAVEMAVCMANGGGGTIVFGVADRVVGRDDAIRGVPPELDVNRLKLAVYDSSEPKITPVFEELYVPEGTGRLVLMHIHPGMPPHTDTRGRGTIRVGTDCKPLTGTLRRRLVEAAGEDDFTAEIVDVPVARIISAAAMESLRASAAAELAPSELLGLGDDDLLTAIGVVRDGRPTRAAVLLAGSTAEIRAHIPYHDWTHVRMTSDTEYGDRADGNDALTVALARILDRIMANNPIETVRSGPYHFEYRTYPETALREALLNALCHADLRVASPRLVKQYSDRIEITNPGGLVGNLTPENILHHAPVTRNHCLVEALSRLRLVNRTNLGMERIFSSLLIEGKPPPEIHDMGDGVRITLRASALSTPFRAFVAEEARQGRTLAVDELLILNHLLDRPHIDAATAADLCQRPPTRAEAILSSLESERGYLLRIQDKQGVLWGLEPELLDRIAPPALLGDGERIDLREAEIKVLDMIEDRARRRAPGLTNADIRRITGLDRHQVRRLIDKLAGTGRVRVKGRGRGTRYIGSGQDDAKDGDVRPRN
ncbi:ATP-binding protein [Candidatus Palauibacter sp.]|uniref:ATP-binding protein n=1 Tax=Candidatus Palauibacter sp. TaxID=3101350 RepID=UPI003B023A06